MIEFARLVVMFIALIITVMCCAVCVGWGLLQLAIWIGTKIERVLFGASLRVGRRFGWRECPNCKRWSRTVAKQYIPRKYRDDDEDSETLCCVDCWVELIEHLSGFPMSEDDIELNRGDREDYGFAS